MITYTTMDLFSDPSLHLSLFGRADFIGGIDNEALDFGPLDQFIHVTSTSGSASQQQQQIGGGVVASSSPQLIIKNTSSHLPESPPDSSSEPPYSPDDLHGLTTLTSNPQNLSDIHHQRQHHSIHHEVLQCSDIDRVVAAAGVQQGVVSSKINIHHLIPNTLYNIRNEQNDQQPRVVITNGGLQHILKNEENLLNLSNSQTAEQILSHNQASTLLELGIPTTTPALDHRTYRNVDLLSATQPQLQISTLSGGGVGPPGDDISPQINSDDLTRLIPDITPVIDVLNYHQHSLSPPVAVVTNISPILSSTATTAITLTTTSTTNLPLTHKTSSRKRKLSQPEQLQQIQSIVKPDPDYLSPSSCLNGGGVVAAGASTSSAPSSPEPQSPVGGVLLDQQAAAAEAATQNSDSSGDSSCSMQCIRFAPFQQQNWHILCDQSLQELSQPHYRVDADKGFNFSNSDDAFVCQKKNHFQITCHAQLQGSAIFVRTTSGLEKIKSFHLHFYGVKLEAPTQTIRVEQSQSDRSKKPFHPVFIDLQNRQVSKITVGRLHFSETTSNNMRKKGRPNPEQRYFQLVVGLHAHTHSGHFPIISHGSERIIVRASNPGQFESDVELCWQRGITQESIFHAGRVGINTDRPDESLVVHGNLKISGHIVQPSDSRAKHEISELDTAKQLENVQKIRIVKYRYDSEFAQYSGLTGNKRYDKSNKNKENDNDEVIDIGVIAQEIQQVLPDAVKEAGSLQLPNGHTINNFLVVNKDRIFMENIGAVKELCKVTGSLETRIEQLERINSRLVKIQKLDRNKECSVNKNFKNQESDSCDETSTSTTEACSNTMIQITMIILVIVMAICLAAISTLYFVEHHTNNERMLFTKRIDNGGSNSVVGGSNIVGSFDGGGLINILDQQKWRKNRLDYPYLPPHKTTTTTTTPQAPKLIISEQQKQHSITSTADENNQNILQINQKKLSNVDVEGGEDNQIWSSKERSAESDNSFVLADVQQQVASATVRNNFRI